jgi:hypothetical protein
VFAIEEEDEYYSNIEAEGLPNGLRIETSPDWYDEDGESVVDTNVRICGTTNDPEGHYPVTFYIDDEVVFQTTYLVKSPPKVEGTFVAKSDELPVGIWEDCEDIYLHGEYAKGKMEITLSIGEDGFSECDDFTYATSYNSEEYGSWDRYLEPDPVWSVVEGGISINFYEDEYYSAGWAFREAYGEMIIHDDGGITSYIGYCQSDLNGDVYIWEDFDFGALMSNVSYSGFKFNYNFTFLKALLLRTF